MSKIQIPFNDWSKMRIRQGKKFATSRYKRYGESGDTFIVENKRYILNGVMQIKLSDVIKRFLSDEGCNSEKEFIDIWEQIHPEKGVRFDDVVWIHFFLPYDKKMEDKLTEVKK